MDNIRHIPLETRLSLADRFVERTGKAFIIFATAFTFASYGGLAYCSLENIGITKTTVKKTAKTIGIFVGIYSPILLIYGRGLSSRRNQNYQESEQEERRIAQS